MKKKTWHEICEFHDQLYDTLVSYLQSFLSLIRLHLGAAFFFPAIWFPAEIPRGSVDENSPDRGSRRLQPAGEGYGLFFLLMFFLVIQPVTPAFCTDFSIPVLCYHQVLPTAKGLFEVSADAFRKQMAMIKADGFQPINSTQLITLLADRMTPAGKPIVITFDDGYKSVFSHAFPIMKEFGFVGVACVYPQFIGTGGGMSWGDLEQLASAGWTIECHSFSHADLGKYPAAANARLEFFKREIVDPKKIIESRIGKPVRFMVWPYGIYTEETEKLAREAGYTGAMTVDGGANYRGMDLFRIKRQVVYRTDSDEKFTIRVEMGALEVKDPFPRPGQEINSFSGMSCTLPGLAGENPENYVFNAKINGGAIDFRFDRQTLRLEGKPLGSVSKGYHFIDVYVRDTRTGVTSQNGWFVTIR